MSANTTAGFRLSAQQEPDLELPRQALCSSRKRMSVLPGTSIVNLVPPRAPRNENASEPDSDAKHRNLQRNTVSKKKNRLRCRRRLMHAYPAERRLRNVRFKERAWIGFPLNGRTGFRGERGPKYFMTPCYLVDCSFQ
jgi:hypothetical protein